MKQLEEILRPPERDLPPYPAKAITLASGERMVVRQAAREEVPLLLEAVRPLTTVARDFYDIVAARTYAELLGWMRYRVRDEYCLVGLIDGVLVGLVNGRSLSKRIGVSYHTIAMRRGRARRGAPVRGQDGVPHRAPRARKRSTSSPRARSASGAG